ncbi:TrkA C-terminal domain-containing protein [Arcanobacterium hippocoleae]|uniref:aspartate-alanine antiporter-like transporter n=1 Tax=Arcanobacterium hippocoleae TaxID=149017 RepID=UPI0033404E02
MPGEELQAGDQIVIVGLADDVFAAVAMIGREVEQHLADYRARVEFESFTVSSKHIAGRTVAALNMPGRFGAIVTRIHRGDLELLATDAARIEVGDRLMVAYPRAEYEQIQNFFGDSERKISQIDAISMGLGMTLGILLGMVEISLPGGMKFSLGTAAGPLIVGMFLGALQKTGPFLWQMPQAANQTIRQLGLLLFLAAVGISSGKAFMGTAFTTTGALAGLMAFAIVVVILVLVIVLGRMIGLSAQRTAGVMAGILGQPAVLAFATSKENDERIEAGYAAIFALGIIMKIILVTIIVAFG